MTFISESFAHPKKENVSLHNEVDHKLWADARYADSDTTIVQNNITIAVNSPLRTNDVNSRPTAHRKEYGIPEHDDKKHRHLLKTSEPAPNQKPCSESDYGVRQTQAPGDRTSLLKNFEPQFAGDKTVYNPVRPPGLAQFLPGEATNDGAKRGVDFRVSQSKSGADCSRQYKISGELDNGSMLRLTFDTPFTGEEKISKDGHLIQSSLTYGQPLSIDFLSVRGERVVERNVTMIETSEVANHNYVTRVVHSDGAETAYKVSPKGDVLERSVKK